MSERFWRNLSTAFGWLSIGLFFGLITFTSSLEIRDLDLWLHLRMGWFICQHGFVPNTDILSCSIFGKPWVNHEWLFQVLIYKVQHAYGFNGLISMQSIVVAFTFLVLLFLGYSRERQWMTVTVLLMVLLVYQARFTIRPDIFSLLFFSLYIYVLSMHLNKRWAVFALVLMQILWTNMHGFFFFGPMLVLVGILSELIKRRIPLPYEWNTVGRLTDEEYNSLKKILVLIILACCVNPLTFHGAWYPVSVFFRLAGDNKIFFEHIVELQRPLTAATIFNNNYEHYKILIIMSALSFVFNRRKIDISSLLVWGIFLGFSLAAIRNLIYFAVAAYMVIMVNVISTTWEDVVPLRFSSYKFKYLTVIVFTFVLMMWMLNYGLQMANDGYFDFDTYMRKSEFFGVNKRVYPYKAVNFLQREKIRGNFFNDFNSGAYLVGRVFPKIKVFIDGRTEEYGANFFENYQRIWRDGSPKAFAYFESKDNITGALLNNAHQQIPQAVLKMFHSLKNWTLVYLDDDGVIFLKQTPQNKPLIDRLAVNLSNWKPKDMDLFKLGTKRIEPYPFTARAYLLESMGADEAALRESKEAIRLAPDYGTPYEMLGKIYDKRHEYKKAFENYRIAAMYLNNKPSRLGLAQEYENLKEYKGAIGQYQRILDVNPIDPQGYLGQARAFAEMGDIKRAGEMLQKAPKLAIEDKVDVQRIRDIINSKKKKVVVPKHSLVKKRR